MVLTFNRVRFEKLRHNKASGLEPVLSHLTVNALFRLPKTKALLFQHVVDQLLCAAYQSDALDA